MNKMKRKMPLLFLAVIMLGIAMVHSPAVNASGATTKTKAVYSMKKYSATYKESGNKITAVYSYQLPQLSGNSKIVKKINASLKKDYKKSLESKKECFEYAKKNKGLDLPYSEQYHTKTTCKLVYNGKGYVSFKYHCQWYAGGVGNVWTYGMTYDLRTGKKLNVSNVISGNKNAVKQKIIDKYCSSITDSDWARDELNDMKISDFQFYLKKGKVIVCFGPYQPGGGNGESHITLKGNYE